MEPTHDPRLDHRPCRAAEQCRWPLLCRRRTLVRPAFQRNPAGAVAGFSGCGSGICSPATAGHGDVQPHDPFHHDRHCIPQHRRHAGLGESRRDIQPAAAASPRHHPARAAIDGGAGDRSRRPRPRHHRCNARRHIRLHDLRGEIAGRRPQARAIDRGRNVDLWRVGGHRHQHRDRCPRRRRRLCGGLRDGVRIGRDVHLPAAAGAAAS